MFDGKVSTYMFCRNMKEKEMNVMSDMVMGKLHCLMVTHMKEYMRTGSATDKAHIGTF